MSFKELFGEQEFREVFNEVECFANEMLSGYNQRLENTPLSGGNKEIFDAVWGNIEFSGGEIYILDSPLLQRLRKIKQLGLAYFVYCGCDYSRYYHTLGVTYLADRMAAAINRCDLEITEEDKNYFRAVVRLAAIFHDSGHMFLSHVSEHYFGKSPLYKRNIQINAFMEKFEKTAGKRTALHELLGCMIVNTKAVYQLLTIVTKYIKGLNGNRVVEIDKLVEYISSLIVGVPVDRESLPYSCIINGPIDADKCDYLSRDSHVTRVPVAVDVSRITQKLSVVKSDEICFSQLWHKDAADSDKYYELAMQDSAEKALFQLCIARTIMFDSVYYHHKVLTAETEFRNLINRLANLEQPFFNNFVEILRHTDEDFNSYFFESLKRGRNEKDCKEIDAIYHEFRKIYERHLPKRVVCLTPDFVSGKQKYTEKFWDSVMSVFDSKDEKDFVCEIKKEYHLIHTILGGEEPSEDRVQIFAIQAPTQVLGHSKIQVPIDLRNGHKRDFRGYELVSSRETSSSSSYIVTDADDKLFVFLAVEKIFMKKYHIYLKEEAFSCGKYDPKDINEKRKLLFDKGYYDDASELISDTLLHNYIPKTRISKIAERFKGYEGPDGYRITAGRLEAYLKQFMCACGDKSKCQSVLEGICILLNKALVLDREYIGHKFPGKFISLAGSEKKLYMVPLGNLRDSAKHMTYFWNDLNCPGLKIETDKSLDELLRMDAVRKIVFYDDGSYSGTQMVSIMQEYMGVAERKTQEKHVEELPEEYKNALREKDICFFFCAFNKDRESDLREELKKMGLGKVSFEYVEDMRVGCLEHERDSWFKDSEQRELIKSILNDIGLSLMLSSKMPKGQCKEGWSQERIERAALGYNNSQQMVILKSSVPTYTITAFWAEGLYKNIEWKPLFRRTRK